MLSYFQHKRNSQELKGIEEQIIELGEIFEPDLGQRNSDVSMNEYDDLQMWKGNQWQQTLIQPLLEIMKSHNSQNLNQKLLTLRSIEKLI